MNTQTVNRNGYLIDQVISKDNDYQELSPHERYLKRQNRKKNILKATIIGICVCVLSAIIKYFIGVMSNSLAIESDAMSSLTESYSYIISTVGIYIAHKKPNKEHPNGYGRIEFLTAIIGSILVIIAGWHYFETSFKRILAPQPSSVTTIQLIIIGVTILGKLFLYFDDKKVGKEYNSAGLITASRNALLSTFSTVLVIFATIVYREFHIDIDGWVGLVIASLMLLTGIIGFKNGISSIIGKPIKASVGNSITNILMKYPPIIGVYDLRVNDNGTGILRGTVNAEVPADTIAEEIYLGFRKAKTEVYRKLGIDLTIGLLTVNYCNDQIFPIYQELQKELNDLEEIKNVHGFNWNKDNNEVDLHVLVDYDKLNNEELDDKIQNLVRKYIPDANILTEYNVNYLENQPKDSPVSCQLD